MSEQSRFLEGSFAPVAEEINAFDLPVTGRVPAERSGRYLRNGPNPIGLDDPGQHWFAGAGMVHGLRLRDGRDELGRAMDACPVVVVNAMPATRTARSVRPAHS